MSGVTRRSVILSGGAAFGLAAAPVAVPLAVAGAAVSFVASLFDW